MKVEMIVGVSQNDFFEYLIQSIMIDIFKNSNDFKNKEDIKKGITYKKKIIQRDGKEIETQIEILNVIKPNLYKCRVDVGDNSNEITYETKYMNENQTLVFYHESYHSNKKMNMWNYYLVSFLLTKVNKRKIKKMLISMENHIQTSKYE